MTSPTRWPDRQPDFHGWRVVGATFVLAVFGWGLGFYGPPVFLEAVRGTRGWSVALVSAAVTMHFLVGAAVVVNLAALYHRFGVPRVTKAGAILLAGGVLGWALAAEPWQLFAATLFSGAGWVALGAAAVNAIIAPWFVRGRPAALAMAYNGASIGGVVFSPLWVAAIAWAGFPVAAAAIGASMVATIWLLADRYFAASPEQLGQRPDGGMAAAAPPASAPIAAAKLAGGRIWRDRRFVTLAAAMSLALFAQIGLLAHLFSLLAPVLGPQLAGLAMGGATVAAIVGRSLVGWLMPVGADRRLVASASCAVQALGSTALLLAHGHDMSLFLAGVILFGAGIGNATSLPPLIAQAEFAQDDVRRVVPMIVATGQASYAFAPAAFGLIRAFGPGDNAAWVFIAAGAIQLLAISMFLAGRPSGSAPSAPKRHGFAN